MLRSNSNTVWENHIVNPEGEKGKAAVVCQIFNLVSFCENVADSKQNRHNHHSLVISAPEVRCDWTQVLILPRAVVFITTAAAIYSLGHGLQTFTAVPRSTQPSALRGTVK